MQRTHKSIRVFKSPLLERFTHVHPVTPLVIWVPIVMGLLWQSFSDEKLSPYLIGGLGAFGFVAWTMTEYVLHRFLFHWEGESSWSQRLHFLIHGLHHDDPNDPTRLVMPPVVSIALGWLFYSLYQWVLGPVWVNPFFAFFLMGYLCYDYTHFAVHHFNPRTRLGKMIKQNHMQHHFVNPNAKFGVSSPIWDYIFGSFESVEEKKRAV